MIYVKTLGLFFLFFFFSGCADIMGVPTPNSQKGDVYFFPEIGIVSKVAFDQGVYMVEQEEVYAKYRKIMYEKVKQRRYFLDVSTQKRPSMMVLDYHVYTYNAISDDLLSLFNPVTAIFGIDYHMNADLNVTVLYRGKVLESYHYEKDFTSKYKNIKSEATEYLDIFMQQLWHDMAIKSKMKRIRKERDEIVKKEGNK